MFDRIQNIKNVVGNNNIIINGNVVINSQILETVAFQLFKKELAILTQEANQQLTDSINECTKAIFKYVQTYHLEHTLLNLSNPSTQFAFYSTVKGFSIVETIEQKDLLVETFIERIQKEWDSIEKMIVDSALEVLPKLTPQALSLIGLFQLRHQMINASLGIMLNLYFSDITQLLDKLESLDILCMDYLKQEHLILPLTGLQSTVSLEQLLLTHYDLYFRHCIHEDVFNDYCKQHPEAHHAIHDSSDFNGACMMELKDVDKHLVSFRFVNSALLKKIINENNQEYMLPHISTFMKMMPVYTEEEVRNYFINISPKWEYIFKLFASQDFLHYDLSIKGKYIGSKIIAKACHGKSLPLNEYNKQNYYD